MRDCVVCNLVSCHIVVCHHRVVGIVKRCKVGCTDGASVGVLAACDQAVERINGVRLNRIICLWSGACLLSRSTGVSHRLLTVSVMNWGTSLGILMSEKKQPMPTN